MQLFRDVLFELGTADLMAFPFHVLQKRLDDTVRCDIRFFQRDRQVELVPPLLALVRAAWSPEARRVRSRGYRSSPRTSAMKRGRESA